MSHLRKSCDGVGGKSSDLLFAGAAFTTAETGAGRAAEAPLVLGDDTVGEAETAEAEGVSVGRPGAVTAAVAFPLGPTVDHALP